MKKITLFTCVFLFIGILTTKAQEPTFSVTITNVSCHGEANGQATAVILSGSSPYTYAWSPGGQTKATATGLSARTYTIEVSNSHGYSETSVTITQPTALYVSASTTANIRCNGGSTGSVSSTHSGGTSPYTYSWSGGGTASSETGLTAGTYTITLTDKNGCTATASTIVTQPIGLSIASSGQTNVSCYGGSNGSAYVTMTGGTPPYTYEWASGQTTSTVTGLAAVPNSVMIYDNCGTLKRGPNFYITQPSELSVSVNILSNVNCNGGNNGNVSAIPTGGTLPYTYSWSGGGTNSTKTGLSAGTYTITLRDSCGATATASATITQPSVLSVSASAKNSAICPGSSDSLFSTASGGTLPYTYSWTPAPFGDLSCSTCQKTNAYPFGTTYTMTVIDNNGCIANASVGITVYPFPYVTITGPLGVICPGNSDTLVASGIGATSYLWNTGATTSTIIVSAPSSGSVTYRVKATNSTGCYDTAHYAISTDCDGNGNSSTNAINIALADTCNPVSYTTEDSVVWFTFYPSDSNAQIIAFSNFLGMPVPHVHRLTLYNSSLTTVVDEPMPDITGANQIRIDISHLAVGAQYYVRAARTPAHSNMQGCNPTPTPTGECNASMRWSFQMCFRYVPVFVPQDSGSESPSTSQLYYESRGQIEDLNNIPRFDIKAYTDHASPAIYASDSAISFVYQHIDTSKLFIDTVQRVDMVLTGSAVQKSQPVFKMQEDSTAGYLNYFLGFVPNGVPKVEGYSRLVYKNVYPNVDMHVYSNTAGTKLYFVCNPAQADPVKSAGNPASIELEFKGATSVSVNGSGGLNVVTELGTINFAPGYAYTDSAGIIKPKSWQASFETVNSNTVKFNTGTTNTNEPLIIQVDQGHVISTTGTSPQWSTYFGGTDAQDLFYDVCSDATGNIYATGSTQSSLYPATTGVVQQSIYNNDENNLNATVAKFSSSDALSWATYYGGADFTTGYGICVGSTGYIYITGYVASPNLPLASAPSSPNNYVQSVWNNNTIDMVNSDAYIAMFSNDGTKTLWATYYGGASASEQGNHIAIDGNSNLYVVGGGAEQSATTTFPLFSSTKSGSYNNSTYGTGFILEFNASNPSTGITREWATRIGDNNPNTSNPSTSTLLGCAVDASNNFYVTGIASGPGYTSPSSLTFAYQGVAINQGEDAVATKFNTNNNIVWSSYYGGNTEEEAHAIAVDHSGNAFITGISYSDNSTGTGIQTKQMSTGFFQSSNGDPTNGNAFIAEFNPSGSLEWGTYFGGTNVLSGQAITIDSHDALYLTGYSREANMPLPGSNPTGTYSQLTYVTGNASYDAYIASFSKANTNPDYAWGTYFGSDEGKGICTAEYSGNNWLYMVGTVGCGSTPQSYPAGSYQQPKYYYNASGDLGTSFISQFNITPVITTEVNTINSPNDGISVFPNPSSRSITVQMELTQKENVEFILYNAIGQMVSDNTLPAEKGSLSHEIDLSLLANGIYLLKVNEGNVFFTKKIIKQN